MMILIRCENLTSERDFHRCVRECLILKNLLSVDLETIETGIVKQTEATLCNLVTLQPAFLL